MDLGSEDVRDSCFAGETLACEIVRPHCPVPGWAVKRGIIGKVPAFEMLDGERTREFVLSREQESKYLAFATGHLNDAALLALDTGLRVGELARRAGMMSILNQS